MNSESQSSRREPLVADRSRGQVLVLFAGALVALLLIGALVVDLGFIFAMKRHQQDAADPAALAAARFIQPTLDTPAMWTAACFYAVENGFNARRTDNNSACPGVATPDGSTVTVHYPPSPGGGDFAGDLGFVEVVVNGSHQSFLAGLIGLANIPVSSGAVAANEPMSGGSSSLVALNPTMCGAGRVHGGGGAGGVYIFPATGVTEPGGYVQVNSNCNAGGSTGTNDTCTDSASQGGFIANGGTTVTAPALYVQGACDMNGASGDFHIPESPLPPGCTVSTCRVDEGASFVGDPLSLVRPPAPGDLTTRQCDAGPPSTALTPSKCNLNGAVTLEPGTYYGGWRINSPSTTITLNPGIYVIAGGGISDTGGLLTSAAGRVFIFSTDASAAFKAACIAGTATNLDGCQGEIRIAGSAAIDLQGLDRTSPCPPYSATGCAFGGMLMWQDATGSSAALNNSGCDITIGGGGSLNISGTIYAACGAVTINGNNSTSGCDTTATVMNCAAVQIISDTWDVGGSAILQMPYDPSAFYQLNLKGLVH
jgi:Flp pilus assembly protein TadG